jgi:hypothetical protein
MNVGLVKLMRDELEIRMLAVRSMRAVDDNVLLLTVKARFVASA